MTTTTPISIENVTSIDIIDLVNNLVTINLGYLGIAVTILVVLGGAFYLFNFKPLKDGLKEQEGTLNALEKEVKENLSSSKDEIKEDLEIFKKEQEGSLSRLASERDGKILSDIKTQIVIFEKTFSEKFDSFAAEKDENLKKIILAEVNDKIRDLEKNITSIIKTSQSETETIIKSLQQSINNLQKNQKESSRKIRFLEVYKYSQEGKMGAIYGTIDLLGEAIDDNSWEIEGSLDDLYKEIKDHTLESDVITRIEEQLVKLDNEKKYDPLVKKIRDNYTKDISD